MRLPFKAPLLYLQLPVKDMAEITGSPTRMSPLRAREAPPTPVIIAPRWGWGGYWIWPIPNDPPAVEEDIIFCRLLTLTGGRATLRSGEDLLGPPSRCDGFLSHRRVIPCS
jgi:hypothetical protein